MSKSPKPGFWSLLAALRFFFAFWVLSDHTYNFVTADRAMPVLSKSGLMAVLCFLVISGFSIAHSYEARPIGFYLRRFRRVAPVNCVALAVLGVGFLVAGELWGGGAKQEMPDLLTWTVNVLLLQSIFTQLIMPTFFPSWSLSIEVMYYVIAPLLARLKPGTTLSLLIASCASYVAWIKLSNYSIQYIAQAPYGYSILAFAFAWLSGWMAYRDPRSLLLTSISIAAGCVVVYADSYGFQTVDYTASIAAYLFWVIIIVTINFPVNVNLDGRVVKFLTYLGDLSFPLYLIHYPVLFVVSTFVWRYHPQSNYGWVEVILSLLAADLTLRLTDKKYRAFLERRPAPMPSDDLQRSAA